jgi:hypothetical protein
MSNLPKVFTHDQVGDQTPDLSFSGPTPTPLGHELLFPEACTEMMCSYQSESSETAVACEDLRLIVLWIF